jgi:hypothetical protein
MLEKTNEVLVERDVFEFYFPESRAESNEDEGSAQAVVYVSKEEHWETGLGSNEGLPIISVVGWTEFNLEELSNDVVPGCCSSRLHDTSVAEQGSNGRKIQPRSV